MATGRTGATTVAATMLAAHKAGIGVFATGGIGGVHRGAEDTFDISADLEELSRTPIIVVSAGAKAILDIEKTLEVLETKGVPVVAFGQSEMPAFWSRNAGFAAPLRLDTALDIANFEKTRRAFGGHGGMLIANPVPTENEIPTAQMEIHINEALIAAEKRQCHRQGGHALSAGQDFSDHRRSQSGNQYCVGDQQCRAGCRYRCGSHPLISVQ